MSYKATATGPLNLWLKEFWGRARLGHGLAQAATGLGALSPLMALANPTGGQVVGGVATITTPNANATQIKQSSQNAIINWQQFSVGANQYVQFLQPNSSAVVLNRVVGSNPSSIFGDITANGQVFLINPNGILFGRGATLDVSGLVASTQNISNADFMTGNYRLIKGSGAPDASVINKGSITTAKNGYVVLAGDYVENDGVINAQTGRVLLAAGGGTTLTLDKVNGLISYSIDGATLARLAGVSNTSEITADGGTVIMTADVANALTATAVNNSGFVAARSIHSRDGVIILAATGGNIENSGTLDASASQAGVAGGSVILRGDAATELTSTSKIDTSGAGAKGGFIDISGHRLHVAGLTQTGAGGDLLIDPAKIHIVAGGASGLGTGNTNSFGTAFLAGKLNANNNVTLVASQSIAHLGTTAIAINATGTGNLALRIGTVAVGAGGTLSGAGCILHGLCQPGTGDKFTPSTGGTIKITGLTINIAGNFFASAQQGHISTGDITAKSVQVTGDNILLGNINAASTVHITALHIGLGTGGNVNAGNITAGGGVQIQAQDSNGSGASVRAGNVQGQYVSMNANAKRRANVTVGSLAATGTGTAAKSISIFAHANGGANSSGGNIRVSGNISAPGRVDLNAFGGLDSGGNIDVAGSINAGGIVTLQAVNDGSFGGSVSVGAVKGQFVNITARDTLATNSNGAHITVNGNIVATGTAPALSPSAGVNLDAGSSGARGGNPTIIVHGDITAANAAVNVIDYGSHGGRAITLGSLSINGGAWSNGKVTATHMNIGFNGAGGNATLNTGTLDATAGRISINNFAPSGSIDIHGGISAASTVRVFQSGLGNMSIDGAVHVGGFFAQFSNDGGGIDINGSVSVAGQFNAAAFGANGADITVNGNITARGVRLNANAGSRSGGNVTVNGNIAASSGSVLIHTTGGITVGGNLQVGNISAAGSVSINASHQGTLSGPQVQTGAITGQAVSISLAGRGAHLKTGAITATGASTGTNCHCESGPGGIPGFVDIRFSRPGSNSAASLSIAGPIKSLHGMVSVSAGSGALKVTGDVDAFKQVIISGNTINIAGSVHGSTGVSINARGSVRGNIHVTGSISASSGNVNLHASNSSGGAGGNISVGNVFAGGRVTITTRGGGSSGANIKTGTITASSGVLIGARYSGSHSFKVQTGAITAEDVLVKLSGHDPIFDAAGITATGPSSSAYQGRNFCSGECGPGSIGIHRGFIGVQLTPNGASGSMSVTGPIVSQHGGVILSVGSGAMVTGAITAARNIFLSGNSITVGSVTGGSSVTISANAVGGTGGNITVNGNVTGSSVSLKAQGSGSDNITVNGNVTATAFNVHVVANSGPSHSGGNIVITGNAIASSGAVFLNATGGGKVGGNIDVGNISASSGVSINARYTGGSTGFHVKTGTITGGFINVNVDGLDPLFSAAGLTGTGRGCECSADVTVTLGDASFNAAPGGSINITGPVTATAGGVRLDAGFGVLNMNGALISATGSFGHVRLLGGQLHVGSITATDNVSISAFGTSGNAASITSAPTDTITGTRVNIRLNNLGSGNGAKLSIGAVHATGVATSSANTGQINISDTGFSGQNVTVTTGNLTATRAINAHISDASGSMSLGKLNAPSIKVSLATGNVKVGNIIAAPGGASLSASSGSLTIASTGNLNLTGDALKASKAIKINMTGNVTLKNVSVTDSLLSASAGGNFKDSTTGKLNFAGGTLKAGGALTLVAGSSVQLGKAILSGSVVNITARSITNSGSAGTITAGGGTLAVTNNISLNGETLHLSGAGETLTGSSVTISSAIVTGTGNLTAHAISEMGASNLSFSGGALHLTGSSVRVAGAKVTATKSVTFKGGSVSMNNLHVAGSAVTISASNGSLNNGGSGSLTAGVGGITIKAKNNIAFGGEAISITGGGAKFSAGGSLNLAGDSVSAAKAVTLKAGTGNINISGVHLKGSVVGITATLGNVSNGTGGGSISAGAGGLGIKAGGNVVLGSETLQVTGGGGAALSAGGSLDLTAATLSVGGNVTLKGATIAESQVTITAGAITETGGSLDLTSATLSASGNVVLQGTTLTESKVSITGGAITETGSNAALTSATITATHAVDIHITHGLNIGGVTLSGSAVSLVAGGTITNSGSLAAITAGAGGLTLKAGGSLLLGGESLHIGGAVLLSAAGNLDLTAATVTAAGNMTIHGAAISEVLTTLTATGTLTETGGSLDLTSASLTAGKGVSLTAGKHILLGKTAITAGSAFSATANGSISDGGSAGTITAGSAVIKAKSGAIDLTGETLHVGGGNATISAAGGIVLTGADIIAGSLSGVTAGSIDLTGVTANVSGTMQLAADKDIILSGVTINTGIFLAAASGTIHNGGGPGTIKADAMAVVSKKDINLSSTDITLGSGAVPGFTGDALLLEVLGGFGIAPSSPVLNGVFLADGKLDLGGLTITGHYLVLQGTDIAILGPVSAPTSGLLVQVIPFDPAATIGVEGGPAATQTFNLSNTGFFALFPGDTIAIGSDIEAGSVFIGANGAFTLAPNTNLFFDTTGPVTGLSLITTTGLVTTLETFVATVGTDVVTAGEVDPTTKTGLGDETDKKHLGQNGGVGGGPQGGTISNDDNPSGVCH